MIPCSTCGAPLAPSARACPRCGGVTASAQNARGRLIIAVVAAVALLLVAVVVVLNVRGSAEGKEEAECVADAIMRGLDPDVFCDS